MSYSFYLCLLHRVVSNTYCVVYPMLSVYLDCPFPILSHLHVFTAIQERHSHRSQNNTHCTHMTVSVIATSVNIYFTRRYINIYGGELAYYVFYTVVIVTFIYILHIVIIMVVDCPSSHIEPEVCLDSSSTDTD